MKKGNFRQATLGAFGFRKTVIHRGGAVNVEIPNLVEDVPTKRLKCIVNVKSILSIIKDSQST